MEYSLLEGGNIAAEEEESVSASHTLPTLASQFQVNFIAVRNSSLF